MALRYNPSPAARLAATSAATLPATGGGRAWMQVARRVASLIVVVVVALAVPATSTPALQASDGYWLLDAEGVVYGFGAAAGFTETHPTPHARPAVAIAPTPTGRGYV